MWKVKRMNTARIVVLTIAVGAGGVAAYPASGSDSKPPPTEPVAQLQTVDFLLTRREKNPSPDRAAAADIVVPEIILANVRVLTIDQVPKEKDGQNSVIGKAAALATARPTGTPSLPAALPISTRSRSAPRIGPPAWQHQCGSLRSRKPDHDTEVTKRT